MLQKYSNMAVDRDMDKDVDKEKDKGNAMDAIIFIRRDTIMHMYPGSVLEFLDSEEGDEREVREVISKNKKRL